MFDDFNTIPFPKDEDVVYVICLKRAGGVEEIPFYVGESGRGLRRLGDYITAQFAAPTDFKVGVVVRALLAAGAEVVVKYKRTSNRRSEEAALIRQLALQYRLLNSEPSFNYKRDDQAQQTERFEAIAAMLLHGSDLSGGVCK